MTTRSKRLHGGAPDAPPNCDLVDGVIACDRPGSAPPADIPTTTTREVKAREILSHFRIELQANGLTVYDVLLAELRDQTQRAKRGKRKWIEQGGLGLFLDALVAGAGSRSNELKDKLCSVAEEYYVHEMEQLQKSSQFRLKTNDMTFESICDFSMEEMESHLSETAPLLVRLSEKLVNPNARRGTSEGVERKSSQEGKEQNGELNSEEAESESEDDDADDAVPRRVARRGRRRQNAKTVAILAMLYGRSNKCNRFSRILGYFWRVTDCKKRTQEVLHQLNLGTSYKTNIRTVEKMAELSKRKLEESVKRHPATWICIDNINRMLRVRDERLHNQSEQQNHTAGYWAINPQKHIPQMFDADDVDYSTVELFSEKDALPDTLDELVLKQTAVCNIHQALNMYVGHLAEKSPTGKPLEAPTQHTLQHNVPRQKTLMHTIPILPHNENSVAEMAVILRKLVEIRGATVAELQKKKILAQGDLLTVQRMRCGHSIVPG